MSEIGHAAAVGSRGPRHALCTAQETATKLKIADDSRRLSEFRALKDDALWGVCEKIVSRLSAEDASYDYALVRNDATHLRYRATRRVPTALPR